jgi:hypothetical protein
LTASLLPTLCSKWLRFSVALLLVVGLSWLLAACGATEEGAPEALDTVDVSAAADSNLRPQEDIQEKPREVVSLGVVPGDFPRDVWVYEPSTVMDFSAPGASQAYVVLRARQPLTRVEADLDRELGQRGWKPTSAAADSTTWDKDGRQVTIGLQQQGADTFIRIDY